MKEVMIGAEDVRDAQFFCAMLAKGFDYEVRPVGIGEFVMSEAYLDLGATIRPEVLKDLKELCSDPTAFAYCPYEEAVFDEAIGSGKSYKSSIITAYYLYHLLCLDKPQLAFDLDEATTITIMNMSINAIQAKKVVFGETKSRITRSPWFARYQPDPNIQSELRFPKDITIMPGHSGEFYPLGYSIICAIMDEAAFYTETETHDVAEEMFYTLKRRIKTRFGTHGLLIMISSPRYTDDFIERKAKEAKSDPRIFCRRKAIWEVVPEDIEAIALGNCFMSEGVKIPMKYQIDFEKNPEKAWRDLGARPSLALEPFFKQWQLVLDCIDPNLKHPIAEDGRLAEWFRGKEGQNYFIHIDLGLTRDACGFAMGHKESKIIIDLAMQIKPPAQGEIDIRDILNTIYELQARGFRIAKVTYDQFQSAGSIQELQKRKIAAERQSVEGTEAYELLKEQINQALIAYYRYEPLMAELKRLELIKGKKVDHPVHGSKDVADAVCGVVFNIVKTPAKKKVSLTIV